MTDEDIRNSAYAKWEAEGRPDGQGERHWLEAEQQLGRTPQTWSADHGGGVSPPTSTGSVEDEQVVEPANDWPGAEKRKTDPARTAGRDE